VAKDGLPTTNSHGENTEKKRKARGTHRKPWKGGRGAGGGDRGGAAELRRLLQCGAAAHEGKGGEMVRGEEEVVLILYRAEGEREEAR
jgi:hypothetical protein